jgi:CRISPR-associated protein Csm3
MKLIHKIILTGEIEVLTDLHIGGSSTTMNIGETDLNVIKSPHNGQPIIPGSSLKGKLRSMLAKVEGSEEIDNDSDEIKEIFGYSREKDMEDNKKMQYITRLIVRDSFLSNSKKMEEWDMENSYTEIKWENTINRTKGGAEHPRQIERVPTGAKFNYEMILDVYDEDITNNKKYLDKIKYAMSLLEDDYLGGCGTRGYGKIRFINQKEETKPIESYASR